METIPESELLTRNLERELAVAAAADETCGCLYMAEAGVWTVICARHQQPRIQRLAA
jgi:hypothetical protein